MTPQARTAIQRQLRLLGNMRYGFSFRAKALMIHGGRIMANNLIGWCDFPQAEMDEISDTVQNLGYGKHSDLTMEEMK